MRSGWAIRQNISLIAINDLLHSLSVIPELNLPKDARSLLKTPVVNPVKCIKNGIYHHFGISKEIKHLIELNQNVPSTLMLTIGIDGLPLTKNPPKVLWPILGIFSNIFGNKNIFIIGAYYGQFKPEDCNEFLEDLVTELCLLIDNGLVYNNIHVKVELRAIICDTPAKSYILNIKGHTAKNSCLRCHTIGLYDNNRVYFPEINSYLRTHNEFVSYIDSSFHCGETILTKIPNFDIIFSIPFDFMHCVCIGIMKKMLKFWIGGVKRHNLALPNHLLFALDQKLNDLGKFIPREFQRAPNENSRKHPLRDANRWKATELRQLLLYTGMVIFQDIVSKQVYEHFLELCVAIRILSLNNITDEYRNFAKSLLAHFVAAFGQIYGQSYMSHNIHIILHLADDTKIFGSINNFSAFQFESYMQPLKKKIKSGFKPLQQLIRRYTEEKMTELNSKHESKSESTYGPFNAKFKLKHRPITIDSGDPQFTGWKMEKYILKLNNGDNCILMNNNDIVIVENIATSKSNKKILIIGRKFNKVAEFFNKPCPSTLLLIQKVSELGHLQSWELTDIKTKLMRLPLPNSSVILPLLHLQ